MIVTASSADLALLKSTITAIESAVDKSQTVRRLHDVCSKFYQIAVIMHDQQQQSRVGQTQTQTQTHSQPRSTLAPEATFPSTDADTMFNTSFPMLQQHWNGFVDDSQLEFGDVDFGEMATFVEPYMTSPFK